MKGSGGLVMVLPHGLMCPVTREESLELRVITFVFIMKHFYLGCGGWQDESPSIEAGLLNEFLML